MSWNNQNVWLFLKSNKNEQIKGVIMKHLHESVENVRG